MAGLATAFSIVFLAADGSATNFGIHAAPGAAPLSSVERQHTGEPATITIVSGGGGVGDLATATRVGAQWGRVTSTRRSPEHNRRVGGVPNSYHLSGRAIDIARRAGVRHSQIDAAFRREGFQLIESLDEGDHTHIAFRRNPVRTVPTSARSANSDGSEAETPSRPRWRMVTAPRSR